MPSDTHFFYSKATQGEIKDKRPWMPSHVRFHIGTDDVLPIRLMLYKVTGKRRWLDPPNCVTFGERAGVLVTERGITVPLSRIKISNKIRRRYRKVIAENLSRMSVPEDEQRGIIGKIFQVVDVAVPWLPVAVVIKEVTVTVGGLGYCTVVNGQQVIIDRDTGKQIYNENSDYWENLMELLPAALDETVRGRSGNKSSMNQVQQRIDDVGADLDIAKVVHGVLDGVRKKQYCSICQQQLGHYAHLEGFEITRMPCCNKISHQFCITEWRKMGNGPCPECSQHHFPSWCVLLIKITARLLAVAAGWTAGNLLVSHLEKRAKGV